MRLPDLHGLTTSSAPFSPRFLERDETGWDWFSIQLDDGRDLMLLQIRRSDSSVDSHSTGTLVGLDGTRTHLSFGQFSLSAQQQCDRTRVIRSIPSDGTSKFREKGSAWTKARRFKIRSSG